MFSPRRLAKNRFIALTVALALFAAALPGCATKARYVLEDIELPSYTGPKARLAVAPIANKSALGGPELGDGLTDLITAVLFKSNRFTLLDRESLPQLEQEADYAGRPMQLAGAELILTGAITCFEPDKFTLGSLLLAAVTLGGSIALKHFCRDCPVGAASYLESSVQMDLKLIDAASGEVIAASSVEGVSQDFGGGLAFLFPEIHLPLVLGGFQGSAAEAALRASAVEAALFLIDETPTDYYGRPAAPKANRLAPIESLALAGYRPVRMAAPALPLKSADQTSRFLNSTAPGYNGPRPKVDYNRQMIIAVQAQPSEAGCKVELAKVVDRGDHLLAVVREICPTIKPQPSRSWYWGQPRMQTRLYLVHRAGKEVRFQWQASESDLAAIENAR